MNQITLDELKAVKNKWLMWYTLGAQDISLRYRRSTIGPFWLTISMAVTIYSMGFLYSHLFRIDTQEYFPYLASGIISWGFISVLLQESSSAFVESYNYIKNQECSLTTFLMRLIFRNLTVFFHNFLAFIPVAFIYNTGFGLNFLLILPGIFIVCVNALFWGGVMATAGTRFRDFEQIIKSLIQVIFFLTPIMWLPSLLPEKYQWVITYNPFASFLSLIRNPMLNKGIDYSVLSMVTLVTILGFYFFTVCINKYKYRIVFWL